MNQSIPVCTPEQIQILKTQQFSETQPGTLVKDFNTLLDFIGENGVVVSEKTQFLAMGLLAELNQRLSNPLDVKLKRPVQKSYPHINGLYLLLRSSGLACLDGDGKKTKLMIDKAMLEKWHQLNPTEQYFFLFQIFYYCANTEIIGEERTRFERTAFFEGIEFFNKDLKKGFVEIKNPNDKDYLRYTGFHNLALMELFGFITIEFDKNNEENWPVSKIKSTDFGNALINYFFENNWITQGLFLFMFLAPNQESKTRWENELKKLIPDWKNNLVVEDKKAISAPQEGCYLFKVSLGRANCKLAVPSNLSLDELAHGILDAFNFGDHQHLYEFIYKNQYGVEERISHPYVDYRQNELTTEQCSIGSLPLYKGMTIIFWFDFGDDWMFKIQVAQMPSPELHFDDLTVIEKKGTPPKQYGWDDE